MEFERVFYKNNFAAGVTIFSLYMIFGGTNWGNIGHPGGYTSYDYGAVCTSPAFPGSQANLQVRPSVRTVPSTGRSTRN